MDSNTISTKLELVTFLSIHVQMTLHIGNTSFDANLKNSQVNLIQT